MSVHVVFGAGQVGSGLAKLLASRGHTVRVVRRSAKPVGTGIETMAADAMNPEEAIRAAAGASVIYHCMNPSAYSGDAWETEFPRQGAALIAAALASGARLVCLDNLYGYGEVEGRRTEQTSMNATGRKSRVRVQWAEMLEKAASERGLRFTVGRAGDFWGPGTGEQSLVGQSMIDRLVAGKAVFLPGAPSATHAFSFVPDVVAGLAALGEAEEVEGRFWHLPIHEVAPEVLVRSLGEAVHQPASIYRIPGWLFGALGWFVPILSELKETLYQWDRPFLADDSAFNQKFPGLKKSFPDAIAMTIGKPITLQ